jgi:hypothetical protein
MISAYKVATLARNRESKTFLVGHSSGIRIELSLSTQSCHRENLSAITGILSDMAEI